MKVFIKDSHERHGSIIILQKNVFKNHWFYAWHENIWCTKKENFMKCDNYIFAYYKNEKKTSHFQSDSKSMNTTDWTKNKSIRVLYKMLIQLNRRACSLVSVVLKMD